MLVSYSTLAQLFAARLPRRTNELSLVPPQFRSSALEAWEIERWESSSFLSLLSYVAAGSMEYDADVYDSGGEYDFESDDEGESNDEDESDDHHIFFHSANVYT